MKTIRPWLSIGTYEETLHRATLDDAGIDAMLVLHREVEHEGLPSLYIPVEEGYALALHDLKRGIDFMLEHKDAGDHVMVACGAGISRSVTFAVGALAAAEGLTLVDSFSQIRKLHERAMPDELHWATLNRMFEESVDFWDLWQLIEL